MKLSTQINYKTFDSFSNLDLNIIQYYIIYYPVINQIAIIKMPKTPLQQAIDQKAKAKGLRKLWWIIEVFKLRVAESEQALFKRQNEIHDERTLNRIEKEMNNKKL